MTTNSKTANRLLWTAQGLLALLFVFAGVMKLVMSAEQMQGPIDLPLSFLRFIGVAETLGGLGLILPGLFRIRTELTGWAAAGLVIIMAGASAISFIGGAGAAVLFPFVVGLMAAAIAYGRWQALPRTTAGTPALQSV